MNLRPSFLSRVSLKSTLDVISMLAVLVTAVVVVRHILALPNPNDRPPRPEVKIPTAPVSLDGAKIKGSSLANVVLLEYSDFQCPYCSKFAKEVLPTIERDYVDTGKVRLAFRHLPLKIHPAAEPAAVAAECASEQGKFWDLHDRLFRQVDLSEAGIQGEIVGLGLDSAKFQACQEGDVLARVKAEASTASQFNITGTPAFLIGVLQTDGRLLVKKNVAGARPVDDFRKALDAVIADTSGDRGRQLPR